MYLWPQINLKYNLLKEFWFRLLIQEKVVTLIEYRNIRIVSLNIIN